jgi:hypothetical protein
MDEEFSKLGKLSTDEKSGKERFELFYLKNVSNTWLFLPRDKLFFIEKAYELVSDSLPVKK